VGLRNCLDVMEYRKISCLCQERTPVVRPVARRYTDRAILADSVVVSVKLNANEKSEEELHTFTYLKKGALSSSLWHQFATRHF
jgi:hypothetical protein